MPDTHATADDKFEQYLNTHRFKGQPANLYEPMNYIMQLGGKRMRPRLLLMAYESTGKTATDEVMQLAMSIETFHNFSLIHDDIMDHAPVRRGKPAVHKKWDEATAILAGDNMLIACYDMILKTGFADKEAMLSLFTRTAREVCEGQQMDMDLPFKAGISEAEYLEMIRLKTAVLPASALKMGAIAAGLPAQTADTFYEFGIQLGMAFQMHDDYLDTFGSSDETGKQEGGDILENKKTLLYLHAIQHLDNSDKQALNNWYSGRVHDNSEKVKVVRNLFRQAGSDIYLNDIKKGFEEKALTLLETLHIDSGVKKAFNELLLQLSSRKS